MNSVKSSKVVLIVLIILLLIVLGLGGLFLWLTGGDEDVAEDSPRGEPTGLVHVRSIYFGDEENIYKPVGIGADDEGNFLVTLRDSQRVMEFDRGGDWVRSFGSKGLAVGQLMAPTGVAVDRLAAHVYVTDRSRLRLICYSLEGEYLWEVPVLNPVAPAVVEEGVLVTTFGPLALFSDQGEVVREVGTRGHDEGQFDYPRAADAVGAEVIVADTNNTRVQRVKLSGETTAATVWVDGQPPRYQDDPDTQYGLPSGVAVDGEGRAFVLDGFRHQIVVVDTESGKRIHTFDELEGDSDGHFKLPTGIAHLGGDYFAITDTYNDRVQIVRLLMPGEDNVVARNPWLLWLIPPALLALLALFLGKKRYYVTRETLELAEKDGNLRLLAGVARKLHVLPEVADRFSDVVEGDIAIREYLVPLESSVDAEDEERALVAASKPDAAGRLLLPRIRVIAADDPQATRVSEMGAKPVLYTELASAYTIADGKSISSGGPAAEETDG